MAILRKKDLLGRYTKSQTHLVSDAGEIRWASDQLKKAADEFDFQKTYDIFLSHAFKDARVVKQIRDELTSKGYEVYVDWIEDKQLDRNKVSKASAIVLRNRMKNCRSLIYLTSASAEKSVWMPWELGYMDAKTSRVAVAPIFEEDDDESFEGREYLGIYPYLDLTGDSFFIQDSPTEYVVLDGWLRGRNPSD